ncbi:MAG: ChbG/HpnK family deacetylase, partial [Selenomonadaceae bacterium]|nr:ChbG/HpnK family deacetylase [Selenomonadaceae bacterium]
MKQIIFNSDDFGRHKLINLAVEKAFRKGCLRSATIMTGARFFEHALEVVKRNPEMGVGIHFTLANGFPVLPPSEIPSLVTPAGYFHANYVEFLKLYLKGKIKRAEIQAELAAQLLKARRAGLKLTHFDSHQHLHHFPGIIGIALKVAKAGKLPAMRVADTKIFDGSIDNVGQLIGRIGLGSLSKFAAHSAHTKNILTPDHFSGIVAGESVTEKFLAKLIKNLEEGTTEVMLHPGTNNEILQKYCDWQHDFEAELNAVTSPKILK